MRKKNRTVLLIGEDNNHIEFYRYLLRKHKKRDNYKISFDKGEGNAKAIWDRTKRKIEKSGDFKRYEKVFVVADDDRQDTPKEKKYETMRLVLIKPCIEFLFMIIIEQKTKYSQEEGCKEIKEQFEEHCKTKHFKEECVDKDESICKALNSKELSRDNNIQTLKKIKKVIEGDFDIFDNELS